MQRESQFYTPVFFLKMTFLNYLRAVNEFCTVCFVYWRKKLLKMDWRNSLEKIYDPVQPFLWLVVINE